MVLKIDDTGSVTKMVITNGSKTLLKKKGQSIKKLLKFIYDGTKKENVKQTILELQPMFMFMKDSVTTIQIVKD